MSFSSLLKTQDLNIWLFKLFRCFILQNRSSENVMIQYKIMFPKYYLFWTVNAIVGFCSYIKRVVHNVSIKSICLQTIIFGTSFLGNECVNVTEAWWYVFIYYYFTNMISWNTVSPILCRYSCNCIGNASILR